MPDTSETNADTGPLAAHDKAEGNSPAGRAVFREICAKLTTAQIGEMAAHRVLNESRRVTRDLMVRAMDMAAIPEPEREALWERYFGGPPTELAEIVRRNIIRHGNLREYGESVGLSHTTLGMILKERKMTNATLQALLKNDVSLGQHAEQLTEQWKADNEAVLMKTSGLNVLGARVETLFALRPNATRMQWVEKNNPPASLRHLSQNARRFLMSDIRHGRPMEWKDVDLILFGMNCTIAERLSVAQAWMRMRRLGDQGKPNERKTAGANTAPDTDEPADDTAPLDQHQVPYPEALLSKSNLEVIVHLLARFTGENVSELLSNEQLLEERLEEIIQFHKYALTLADLRETIIPGNDAEYESVPEDTTPLDHMKELLSQPVIRARPVIAAADEFVAALRQAHSQGQEGTNDMEADFLYIYLNCRKALRDTGTDIQQSIAALLDHLPGTKSDGMIQSHPPTRQGTIVSAPLSKKRGILRQDPITHMEQLLSQVIIPAEEVLAAADDFEAVITQLQEDRETVISQFRYVRMYCEQLVKGMISSPMKAKVASVIASIGALQPNDMSAVFAETGSEGDVDELEQTDDDASDELEQTTTDDEVDELEQNDDDASDELEQATTDDEVDEEQIAEEQIDEEKTDDEEQEEPADNEHAEDKEPASLETRLFGEEPLPAEPDPEEEQPEPQDFTGERGVWSLGEYLYGFSAKDCMGATHYEDDFARVAEEVRARSLTAPLGIDDTANALKMLAYCYGRFPDDDATGLLMTAIEAGIERIPAAKLMELLTAEPRFSAFLVYYRDTHPDSVVTKMFASMTDLNRLSIPEDFDPDAATDADMSYEEILSPKSAEDPAPRSKKTSKDRRDDAKRKLQEEVEKEDAAEDDDPLE